MVPLIDPTANVLNLVNAAMKRQDDLRDQAEKFQQQLREQGDKFSVTLAKQRWMYEKEAKEAESSRINALLLANKNDVALALEKQTAQAVAQDRRISLVEQNQYQGVGATGQRAEGRMHSQWVIGLIIGMCVAAAELLSHFLK